MYGNTTYNAEGKKIVHLALIDAVELGYTGQVQPVSTRPPVENLFNRYQEHESPALSETLADAALYAFMPSYLPTSKWYEISDLAQDIFMAWQHGAPAHGIALGGDDDETLGLNATHMSIDGTDIIDPKYKEEKILLLDSIVDFIIQHMNDQ